MLVSYNWLQSYFKEPLPEPEKLADILTMGIFEIESIERVGEGSKQDAVFDVKVLPDRAPYCLSHRYIAQEVGALVNQPVIIKDAPDIKIQGSERQLAINVLPEALGFCKRYTGRIIENVSVIDSPLWLKEQLEAIGQRSINTIVDLTNYVMFETGQPLHAFDADKVEGAIHVRKAKEGEELMLLDGKVIMLNSSMLVIADDESPLALAGVKGGRKAEVTAETKHIILESACFDPASTRRTSQAVGIRNESSKRFENGVTPERAGMALAYVTEHIYSLNPNCIIGEALDIYPEPAENVILNVRIEDIQNRLGVSISKEEILDILGRCGLYANEHTDDTGDDIVDTIIVSVPTHRPDIKITEDVVDEIGRIYGYDRIEGVVPTADPERKISKNFYYQNLIRQILAELGFFEVYTYSLTDAGEKAVQNPLTVERAYMRNSISDLLAKKFLLNMKNADLLGLREIRMFELGKIFGAALGANDELKTGEKGSLAFGVARSKQAKDHDPKTELIAITTYIMKLLGGTDAVSDLPECTYKELTGDAQTMCTGYIIEFNLDALINSLPDPVEDIEFPPLTEVRFSPISSYPFAARDVAVFVPGEGGAEEDVLKVVSNALSEEEQGLLVRSTLFDVFTKRKEGEPVKTSYAYRLVFQSATRTLTEEEIVTMMKKITDTLSTQVGWEVR